MAAAARAQWSAREGDPMPPVGADKHLCQVFSKAEWDASNFAPPESIRKFRDLRYGMFIHFGLTKGQDLGWGVCHTRKVPDSLCNGERGPIPDDVWTQWPKEMRLEKFNAEEWVRIARDSGMKYIVTITKHHDGFHLWDTAYSDWKITKTPFGRDYLKEISDACHKARMPFGVYYSQRDWTHPDYAPIDPETVEKIDEPPYFKAKPGRKIQPGPSHKKYIEYQNNVVRELCTKYGRIDYFWFDACWWGGMYTAEMWDAERLTRMIRELQPGIVINNRAGVPGDFDTPEQRIGFFQDRRPWESCMCLCDTWCWSDTPVKSKKDLVRMLVNCAAGDGNVLLSWGPKWEGSFDETQVKRLREVGEWLQRYGTSIYETRGGPWRPGSWGGSVTREDRIWLHVLEFPEGGLTLPPPARRVIAARALTGGEATWSQDKTALRVNVPAADRDPVDTIVELTLEP
jgi:alpha-L-fucosidase